MKLRQAIGELSRYIVSANIHQLERVLAEFDFNVPKAITTPTVDSHYYSEFWKQFDQALYRTNIGRLTPGAQIKLAEVDRLGFVQGFGRFVDDQQTSRRDMLARISTRALRKAVHGPPPLKPHLKRFFRMSIIELRELERRRNVSYRVP